MDGEALRHVLAAPSRMVSANKPDTGDMTCRDAPRLAETVQLRQQRVVNPDVDITAHIGVCAHLCSSHLSQINIIIARSYKGQRSIFLLFSFPTSDLALISASLHYLCLRGFWEQRSASLSPAGFGAGSGNVPGTLSVSRRDGEL